MAAVGMGAYKVPCGLTFPVCAMNVLFVTSNRIGDAVLSTGLVNHIIEAYPEAVVLALQAATFDHTANS